MTLLKIVRRKTQKKKNAILHTFRQSNLGGILAKELFKFLLTEVFKIVNTGQHLHNDIVHS